MTDIINVQDLSAEQVKALKKLAELFRKQHPKKNRKGGKEPFAFASHPSNVIGELTRESIYEDR